MNLFKNFVLYLYYNVATLLLHRRWSLDRRSFSSSTPPALESCVDISKAHWGEKSFEVAFEFLCTGWFNNWTVDTGTLCVNIFYSKTWAKTGMDLSCLVHMVLINPQPPIYNFTSYWQIFQDFICRLIVWLDQLPSSFFPRCFERPCSPKISRVICRFPGIIRDSLAIIESHFDFIKAMNT